MPYNGSGVFAPPAADYPAVSLTLIESTKRNNIDSDFSTGLSTAITKDGQTTPTANIPLGGFKITGLGAGTAATDAARLGQVQGAAVAQLGTIAGTNTITAVATPVITAYAAGQTFRFIPANTTTGATTINIDGVGAKNIYFGNRALVSGEIRQNVPCQIFYDGTQFQLQGPFVGGSIGTAVGSGSVAPIEFVHGDCGLVLTSTNTPIGSESYIIGMLKNAAGTYFKAGVVAFQVTDLTASNEYGSINLHCGGYVAGVYSDDFVLAGWHLHGAEFFGSSLAAGPGLDILKISGDLQVTGTANFRGTTGAVLVGASGTATALGANITTLQIKGQSTIATGGLRISSSDASVDGGFYGNASELFLGSSTSHPTNFVFAGVNKMTLASASLTFADSFNFIFNATNGTKFGTATNQKIGFWNATPIVQPATGGAASTFAANTSGIANDTATFDSYTIGQVVKALRNTGILT